MRKKKGVSYACLAGIESGKGRLSWPRDFKNRAFPKTDVLGCGE